MIKVWLLFFFMMWLKRQCKFDRYDLNKFDTKNQVGDKYASKLTVRSLQDLIVIMIYLLCCYCFHIVLKLKLFSSLACSLPVAWNGKWFIDEFANEHPSTINSSTNSISRFATDVNQKLGNCIWQDRDFYIFQ